MRRDEFGFDPEEMAAERAWWRQQQGVDNTKAAADKGEVAATDDASD